VIFPFTPSQVLLVKPWSYAEAAAKRPARRNPESDECWYFGAGELRLEGRMISPHDIIAGVHTWIPPIQTLSPLAPIEDNLDVNVDFLFILNSKDETEV
jgi:hypothetical protein